MKKHKKGYAISIDSRKADEGSMPKMPPRAAIQRAGHEMKVNEPAILAHTKKKFGKKKARKQKLAIMFQKARKEG